MSQQHSIEKLPVSYDELKINIHTTQNQQHLRSMNLGTRTMSESYESEPFSRVTKDTEHNTLVYIMAGAAAGIMEHCVMYPVDSIKVVS